MATKLNLKSGCGLIILVIVIGIVLGVSAKKCSNTTPQKPKQSEVAAVAATLVDEPVKALLVAPASASFEEETKSSHANTFDSTVVVTGYVNSQNLYGAMLRTGYRVKFKYLGDINEAENWAVLESQLFE